MDHADIRGLGTAIHLSIAGLPRSNIGDHHADALIAHSRIPLIGARASRDPEGFYFGQPVVTRECTQLLRRGIAAGMPRIAMAKSIGRNHQTFWAIQETENPRRTYQAATAALRSFATDFFS